jgi:hypothetical protein
LVLEESREVVAIGGGACLLGQLLEDLAGVVGVPEEGRSMRSRTRRW